MRGHVYVCVRDNDLASFYDFLLDVETVPTVWLFFVAYFLLHFAKDMWFKKCLKIMIIRSGKSKKDI